MKNYVLSTAIDGALSAVLTFLIFRAALSFLSVGNALSLCLSITAALACSAVLTFFKIKKNKRLFIKNDERKRLENILDEFEIMPDNELIGWFFELFKALDLSPEIKKDRLITESGCNCFFNFSAKLTRENVADVLKKCKKTEKIVLFCAGISDEARALLKTFSGNFFIAEPDSLYELMKTADFFYEPKILLFRKKAALKERIKGVLKLNFTKKRAAVFTLLGLVALVFSPFTFFKKYYLIYAVCCFLIAAACLVFGKNEPKSSRELPLKKSA